ALGADPADVGAGFGDRVVRVAELAGRDRAAGRVVLRIEIDDRPATALVGQSMDGAGLVGKSDLGREVARCGRAHRQRVAAISTTRTWPIPTLSAASGTSRTFDRPGPAPNGRASSSRG